MFKKQKCSQCNRKSKSSFDFCPHCGNQLNKNLGRDYGMLGTNDLVNPLDMLSQSMFGGGMLGKMLGSTMKMLEKEMQKMEKEASQENTLQPNTNFQMFVNGKPVNFANKQPAQKQQKKVLTEAPPIYFSKTKTQEFSKFPQKEPETNLKRLPEKIIYELKLPGVKNLEDVSIVRRENSIEIKAIGNKKSYSKVINIGLPIINYELEKGLLTLELESKN